MTITVHFDVRALQDKNFATKGIGQHALYVLSVLRNLPSVRMRPVADPSLGPILVDVSGFFDLDACWINDIKGDVYFNPSPLTHDTAPFVVALRNGLKTCAVVHDFIPLRLPEFMTDPERSAFYLYLVETLGKYDGLFANSLFTAQEIARVLPNYIGKVIPLRCRSRFQEREPTSPGDMEAQTGALAQVSAVGPYVFAVTARDSRKNPEIFIRAAADFRALGLRLVIGGGLTPSQAKRLAFQMGRRVANDTLFVPHLTDAELRQVYVGARVVVVASLDEGFSLPVAEAIGLGSFVVASDIPAHSEQITDRRLLFSAHDVDSMMASISYASSLVAHERRLHQHQPDRFYARIDHGAERHAFAAFIEEVHPKQQNSPLTELTIVVSNLKNAKNFYDSNRLMVAYLHERGVKIDQTSLENTEISKFYQVLLHIQEKTPIYVGNETIYADSRLTMAIQNVPGYCISSYSRLIEISQFLRYFVRRVDHFVRRASRLLQRASQLVPAFHSMR